MEISGLQRAMSLIKKSLPPADVRMVSDRHSHALSLQTETANSLRAVTVLRIANKTNAAKKIFEKRDALVHLK